MSQKPNTKRKRSRLAEFIDDEAQLSSEDEGKVSSDENEDSDDDAELEGLVDHEARDLDSDEEEDIRGLYHKQLEQENRREVLIMQEHVEENAITYGQSRRKRFRWQEKELMENNLRRHYDPDDEDANDGDDSDDEDDVDFTDIRPKLRRPDAESLLIKSTKAMSDRLADRQSSQSNIINDDSNSNTMTIRPGPSKNLTRSSDIRGFLFRDKEVVEALSTRETLIKTREDKDKIITREINRVLQTKSVFDLIS